MNTFPITLYNTSITYVWGCVHNMTYLLDIIRILSTYSHEENAVYYSKPRESSASSPQVG